MNRWAAAKYTVSQKPDIGYEEKARLTIPYGHVGVLQVGPSQVVLPPRTYTNLPQGDDEVQDLEALCVTPGMIAWRFNYSSQMEVREARAECYLLPKAGWEIVPSLRVEQGQIAYRMTEDGSFEFRSPTPGAYPGEIASRWVVTRAVQIAPSTFGIYIKPDGTPVALSPGIHYDEVPSFVNVYSADEMRYRTLAVDVYNTNKPRTRRPALRNCAARSSTRLSFRGLSGWLHSTWMSVSKRWIRPTIRMCWPSI